MSLKMTIKGAPSIPFDTNSIGWMFLLDAEATGCQVSPGVDVEN